jgi:hypothetical protein
LVVGRSSFAAGRWSLVARLLTSSDLIVAHPTCIPVDDDVRSLW